jgi:hypothetical protein
MSRIFARLEVARDAGASQAYPADLDMREMRVGRVVSKMMTIFLGGLGVQNAAAVLTQRRRLRTLRYSAKEGGDKHTRSFQRSS